MAGDDVYPENKAPRRRFTPPRRPAFGAASRSDRPVPPAAQIAVLVPGQPDHDEIDRRDQQQRHRMRQRIPVYLIDDEQREKDERHRIIPETLAHQPDDDPQFDRAVAQQIERDEMLRADRQVLRPVGEMGGDEIVRVLRQFGLRERPDKIGDRVERDDIDPDRRDDFAGREKRLEQQRDFEKPVKALLAARCRSFRPPGSRRFGQQRQLHGTLPSSASAGRIG